MTIKHAPWGTPAPPVTTSQWSQEDWDRFAERYRPIGYLGEIGDEELYYRWVAKQRVDAAVEYFNNRKEIPLATLTDITGYIRVARRCRCGRCLCCKVLDEVKERRMKHGSSWWREKK